jgi:ribose/xylose/arabinose/galactoside ABC-type transport system permease subunit/ABC-type sugar transport system substrate-binding protein
MPSYHPGKTSMTTDRRNFLALLAAVAAAPAVGQSTRPRSIALLFDSLISPFWVAALENFRRQITARGWLVLEAVSNMDDNRQYTQVKSMIERGVDGIVIVHTDDKAVIPAIRAANAAGVPMIHFNRAPAANNAYSVAVVADNRKLMDDTVTALIDIARRQPKRYQAAILLGDLGDANAVNRRDGFNDAVARVSDVIDVVARITTEWNADKAFAGLSNALRARPGIDFLVSSSDFLIPQIEQALRVADKWHPSGTPGHVLIAGFDGDDNGYAQLAAGYYDVDGVQNLDYEVELTLQALDRLWAGERLPKTLIDPGFVIGRETLDAKRDEMWGYGVWKAKSTVVARNSNWTPATSSPPSITPGPAKPANPVIFAPNGLSNIGHGVTWILVLATFSGFAKTLFSVATLRDVILAMLPLSILVVGQMLILLIGQIDLSMTAVMAMGSIVSASVMTRYAPVIGEPSITALGVLTFLGIGAAIGLFNGVCVAILRVPSFIATLAVMMAGSGGAVWYASTVSDTISIGGLPSAFGFIGYGTVMGIPMALILSVGTLSAAHFVLSRTVTGRWLYALGHNTMAARISGVPVRKVTVAAFVASGLCAGVAAIIYTSRIETGVPTLGQNMLLDIVGAAVIGGVSLFGGRGSIWMVAAGVAFLCLLDKSLQLLGVSLFVVLAVKGIAILAAALFDAERTRRVRGT